MKPAGKACERKGMGEGRLKGPGSKRSMPGGHQAWRFPELDPFEFFRALAPPVYGRAITWSGSLTRAVLRAAASS
jgi:hypothetical protein